MFIRLSFVLSREGRISDEEQNKAGCVKNVVRLKLNKDNFSRPNLQYCIFYLLLIRKQILFSSIEFFVYYFINLHVNGFATAL